jgi:Restriction endonuclease
MNGIRHPSSFPEEPLSPEEYEQLTKGIVERLNRQDVFRTDRVAQNEVIIGRSGPNQIDVIWEGAVNETRERWVFECRHYKNPIKRKDLHAFRGVVDDISDDLPTRGYMVTKTGYQRGAKKVAETYGITIIELREPTSEDLNGRILGFTLNFTMRGVVVDDVEYEFAEGEVFDDYAPAEILTARGNDGVDRPLLFFIADGEVNEMDKPPRERHFVDKSFEPPLEVDFDEPEPLHVTRIRCYVGQSETRGTRNIGPGADGVAWMVKDVIGGSRAWFARDGKFWISPT